MSNNSNSANPKLPKSLQDVLTILKTLVGWLSTKRDPKHKDFNDIYQSLDDWSKDTKNPPDFNDANLKKKLDDLWKDYFEPQNGEYQPFVDRNDTKYQERLLDNLENIKVREHSIRHWTRHQSGLQGKDFSMFWKNSDKPIRQD